MTRKLFVLLCLLLGLTAQAQNRQRISILGDSYSTFQDYIPEGNEPWYTLPRDAKRTDVEKVSQTWWWEISTL